MAQLFLVGFAGCSLGSDHWLRNTLKRLQLGGVILFDRTIRREVQNIRSPQQLKSLVESLQEISEIPLFVAIDQEGGQVCRLKERDGFAPSRTARSLAGEGVGATSRQAAEMAREMAECGINLNFAPVVDLDRNPDNPIIGRYGRSFGAEPKLVAAHALEFVRAHHAHGLACCLKHFPGHGSAGGDSHLGFVDITAEWQEVELAPYRLLLEAGYGDGIMTAHLVHQQLDPAGMPATLSEPVLNGLLRGTLGFTEVIFSDDLQMRAIANHWDYAEAVQRAVLAGVDVLVVGNNLTPRTDLVELGVQAVADLLDSGRVDEKSIDLSLERIHRLKAQIAGTCPWKPLARPTAC